MEIKITTKYGIGDKVIVFVNSERKLKETEIAKISASVNTEGQTLFYYDVDGNIYFEKDLYSSREEFISQL